MEKININMSDTNGTISDSNGTISKSIGPINTSKSNDNNMIKKIEIDKFGLSEDKINTEDIHVIQNNQPHQNNWDYATKLFLKKIGEKAMGYKIMHTKDQYYNSDINDKFKVAEIILLSILFTVQSGSFVGILADTGLRDNVISMAIISGIEIIIVLVYSVVYGLKENGDYDRNTIEHKIAASQYGKLNTKIQQYIFFKDSKDKKIQRLKDKNYIKKIASKYNKTQEISPMIREETLNVYIINTENKGIHRPVLVGDIEEIKIVIDDNKDNKNIDSVDVKNKIADQLNNWLRHI